MHCLVQKFCIEDCDWLRPESSTRRRNVNQKPNQMDLAKKNELLSEFLYWLFNSFVIDLVKVSFTQLPPKSIVGADMI